jgi:hypothetical protein
LGKERGLIGPTIIEEDRTELERFKKMIAKYASEIIIADTYLASNLYRAMTKERYGYSLKMVQIQDIHRSREKTFERERSKRLGPITTADCGER